MSDKPRQEMGLPRVFDVDVVCPAGRPIMESPKGSGVLCRLTDSPIVVQDDPHSLAFCCTQSYQQCPVWRAEKENIERQRNHLRRTPLLEAMDAA